MNTTAAHSFQWLCVNMDSDAYDIKARFSLTAKAQNLCEALNGPAKCAFVDDPAQARVILQKRIMTAQQVRAVKGSLEL